MDGTSDFDHTKPECLLCCAIIVVLYDLVHTLFTVQITVRRYHTHPFPMLVVIMSKTTTESIGIDVYSLRSAWKATVP